MPGTFSPNKPLSLLGTAALAAVAVSQLWLPSALSRADDLDVDSGIGHSQGGIMMSNQLLELGTPTSHALRLEGEQSMRFGNIEKAISALQRAVEIEPTDLEGRSLYAEALEKKLRRQKERDPRLYNYCIKQWLYVCKEGEFQDQTQTAQNHLEGLTGSRPGRWEKSAKYLSRVMIPEDGSTKVALGKRVKTE